MIHAPARGSARADLALEVGGQGRHPEQRLPGPAAQRDVHRPAARQRRERGSSGRGRGGRRRGRRGRPHDLGDGGLGHLEGDRPTRACGAGEMSTETALRRHRRPDRRGRGRREELHVVAVLRALRERQPHGLGDLGVGAAEAALGAELPEEHDPPPLARSHVDRQCGGGGGLDVGGRTLQHGDRPCLDGGRPVQGPHGGGPPGGHQDQGGRGRQHRREPPAVLPAPVARAPGARTGGRSRSGCGRARRPTAGRRPPAAAAPRAAGRRSGRPRRDRRGRSRPGSRGASLAAGQRGAQGGEAPVRVALHGAFGEAEGGRDVLFGEVGVVPQHEHLLLAARQGA